PRPTPANEPTVLTIDPRSGTVEIKDLGPPGTPQLPPITVPLLGQVACGTAGLCSPINIALPLP
ncbi:MAG: hypothetical protein ABIO67_12875, partial [Mycobacteriales bacterium]